MAKWIGNETNTSGSYYNRGCEELSKRSGGAGDVVRLYKFNSRFGENYYISDEDIIDDIELLLKKEDSAELIDYLYKMIIDKFGAINLLVNIGHKISQQRDEGYRSGKEAARNDMKKALGL